jgi:hypothetical protein
MTKFVRMNEHLSSYAFQTEPHRPPPPVNRLLCYVYLITVRKFHLQTIYNGLKSSPCHTFRPANLNALHTLRLTTYLILLRYSVLGGASIAVPQHKYCTCVSKCFTELSSSACMNNGRIILRTSLRFTLIHTQYAVWYNAWKIHSLLTVNDGSAAKILY